VKDIGRRIGGFIDEVGAELRKTTWPVRRELMESTLVVGAFIVGFLNNIMNLANVNSYLQQIARGAIIALAVIYDISTKNRRTRSLLKVVLK